MLGGGEWDDARGKVAAAGGSIGSHTAIFAVWLSVENHIVRRYQAPAVGSIESHTAKMAVWLSLENHIVRRYPGVLPGGGPRG